MAERRQKHIPIRSCVVCRLTSDKRTLLRVVRQPEKIGGRVVVDSTGKLAGRGAYVCANEKCIGLAHKQKRFERALTVAADALDAGLFERLRSLVIGRDGVSSAELAETNAAPKML